MRYLVDTDWAIHYLNGHPQIVKKLDDLKEQGLALSVISLAELYNEKDFFEAIDRLPIESI